MAKSILIILSIFLLLGCLSCSEDKKEEKKTKPLTEEEQFNPKYKKIFKNTQLIGTEYKYKNLSFVLPEIFTKNDESSYLSKNGLNVVLNFDEFEGELNLYKTSVVERLKKENAVFKEIESEIIYLNKRDAIKSSFEIKREFYSIVIYSMLVKKDKDIYVFNISGKKEAIEPNKEIINDIFTTLLIQ